MTVKPDPEAEEGSPAWVAYNIAPSGKCLACDSNDCLNCYGTACGCPCDKDRF